MQAFREHHLATAAEGLLGAAHGACELVMLMVMTMTAEDRLVK